MKRTLKVIKETPGGKNIMFEDSFTKERILVPEAVRRTKQGIYPNLYVKNTSNGKIVVSKPNNSKIDNLG